MALTDELVRGCAALDEILLSQRTTRLDLPRPPGLVTTQFCLQNEPDLVVERTRLERDLAEAHLISPAAARRLNRRTHNAVAEHASRREGHGSGASVGRDPFRNRPRAGREPAAAVAHAAIRRRLFDPRCAAPEDRRRVGDTLRSGDRTAAPGQTLYDDIISLSGKTTFEAITHALMTTPLTDDAGAPLGDALSLVERVEAVKGRMTSVAK